MHKTNQNPYNPLIFGTSSSVSVTTTLNFLLSDILIRPLVLKCDVQNDTECVLIELSTKNRLIKNIKMENKHHKHVGTTINDQKSCCK